MTIDTRAVRLATGVLFALVLSSSTVLADTIDVSIVSVDVKVQANISGGWDFTVTPRSSPTYSAVLYNSSNVLITNYGNVSNPLNTFSVTGHLNSFDVLTDSTVNTSLMTMSIVSAPYTPSSISSATLDPLASNRIRPPSALPPAGEIALKFTDGNGLRLDFAPLGGKLTFQSALNAYTGFGTADVLLAVPAPLPSTAQCGLALIAGLGVSPLLRRPHIRRLSPSA